MDRRRNTSANCAGNCRFVFYAKAPAAKGQQGVLHAATVNIPDCLHHRDAEYTESLFNMIPSFVFLGVLGASAVNFPVLFSTI